MSVVGEDKRRVAKIVGAAVAALAGCLMILSFGYVLGSSGGYYDAQADGYSAQIGKATDSQIEGCFGQPDTTILTARQCVEQAVRSSREDKRDEQDLSAQRQMAKWAFWLLLVTASQMPLSALGLYLLLRTIWQGQDALTHARETTAIEMRPWIDFTIDVWKIDKSEEGFRFSFTVKLRNLGKTPALRVRAGAEAGCFGEDDAVQRFFASGYTDKGATERTILPNSEGMDINFADLAAEDAVLLEDGDCKAFFPHVSINVAYTWAGSDEGGLTSRCFVVGPPDDSDESVFGIAEDQEFPMKEGIAARDSGLGHAT